MSDTGSIRRVQPELAPNFTQARENQRSAGEKHRGAAELAECLLADAYELGASDIHLEPHHDGARIRFRLHGAVRDVCHLETHQGRILVNQFKAMANLDPIVRFTPREAHAQFQSKDGPIDLRMALAPTLDRDVLSIRILDARRLERSITELGMSASNLQLLTEWLDDINGMFVATGPTGSGKTTTIYALLHALKNANRVILSLEDPVEYQVDGITQIQIDELHDFQFSDGIRSVLRHDPDFLMLGEVRDPESARTAVSAAIAGRAVLTTMHSRDCVGAVTALRNAGLHDHQIGESLSVIVAQRLIRKICLECCERNLPTAREASWFEALGLDCSKHLWTSRGCDKCRQLGFRGRTGLFELWRLDESDYQMIVRHADEHRLRAWLAEKGHRFLVNEALAALDQGVTTFDEVRRVAAGTFTGSAPASFSGIVPTLAVSGTA